MRFWGITGTNGKTTTAWILADFLGAGYITTVEVNTLARRFHTGYTTPPLKQLEAIYAEMEAAGAKDCVMEVSSHAIHQNRVGFGETTVFSGGAFTNLSEDHLDYHKTMEEYFRVKLSFAERIAESAKARPDMGRRELPPFVVCLDGGYGREMLEAAGRLPLDVIPVSVADAKFDLSGLKLVGDYNKSNVLVAAPDGLEKVLSAARGFTIGRLWVVFGAGGDRDRAKRPLMGEASERLADMVVVTSDNPRSEDPMSIIDGILAGMRDRSRAVVEPDRRKAIRFALGAAEAGDTVLVCGKGHETTQEIAGVKYHFNDREEVLAFV